MFFLFFYSFSSSPIIDYWSVYWLLDLVIFHIFIVFNSFCQFLFLKLCCIILQCIIATDGCIFKMFYLIFNAQCTLVQMRGLGIACRLSVCPSVCL